MTEHVRQRRFEELPSPDPATVTALADDHPAILQRLPLFEGTVVSAETSPRIFISGENNRKIGRVITKGAWKGMPIYTLTLAERMTCPTECHLYASCYGNAMPFARRHAPGRALEERIPNDLSELQAQHPNGFVVRLHILGDFYSAAYAGIWASALRAYPALRVYGYTALDETTDASLLKALDVIESMNEAYPDRCFIRFSGPESLPGGATTIDRLPEGPNVKEGLVCPAERDATACCATCGMCWEPATRKRTIVFVKHGMGSRKTERMAREASRTNEAGVRAIAPLGNMKGLAAAPLNTPPTLMWVAPTDLHVDERYQRNLSKSSMKLIARVVQHWNWSHYKPPICTKDDNGVLYVLDGQHTAIAAATHPGIKQIPIMVVTAAEERQRARAFIGHNRDRISVTPIQLHYSSITAQDAEALTIDRVCTAAGVTIVKSIAVSPRETVALHAIRSTLRQFGESITRDVLVALANANLCPIRAQEIKAAAHLLTHGRSIEDITNGVSALPFAEAIAEARKCAGDTALPLIEALATVYMRHIDDAQVRSTEEPADATV